MEWEHLLNTDRKRSRLDDVVAMSGRKDPRSEFQRDYGKAIFSTPVRRLQDKAQVFPLERNDSVRTRLTHSLEVSTVAHDIAAAIAQRIFPASNEQDQQKSTAIREIARVGGLVHDIGNPPFGHAGEEAIASWFEARIRTDKNIKAAFQRATGGKPQLRNDFLKFDGNPQTMRLLIHLNALVKPYAFNFTYGSLAAALKYVCSAEHSNKNSKHHEIRKPGFFASEEHVIKDVWEAVGTGGARHPVTYIIEAADDIVNAAVDIEDAIRKGAINWRDLDPKLRKNSRNTPIVQGVLDNTFAESAEPDELRPRLRADIFAQAFRTEVIAVCVPAAVEAFIRKYADIMQGKYHGELAEEREFGNLIGFVKGLMQPVFASVEVLKLEVMGRRVIHDLLDLFWEGVSNAEAGFGKKIFNLISENYRRVYDNAVDEGRFAKEYFQFRLITDYVSGMTDTFAIQVHEDLWNG